MRFELDALKEKTNLTNDPVFTLINEATIIDLDELLE
jgi:hypothetical protein